MLIQFHTRGRTLSSSSMKHSDESVSVTLICSGDDDQEDHTVAFFPTNRSQSQQFVQALREAAAKMERLLGVEPPTMPTEPTRSKRCARCNVTQEPSEDEGVVGRDGILRCEECADVVEEELAAADEAEGHPCHRDDQ